MQFALIARSPTPVCAAPQLQVTGNPSDEYIDQIRQHYARQTAEPDEQLPLCGNDPPF